MAGEIFYQPPQPQQRRTTAPVPAQGDQPPRRTPALMMACVLAWPTGLEYQAPQRAPTVPVPAQGDSPPRRTSAPGMATVLQSWPTGYEYQPYQLPRNPPIPTPGDQPPRYSVAPLFTVLNSWIPPDPQPTQRPVTLPVPAQGQQPPRYSAAPLAALVGSWTPPDPTPRQRPPAVVTASSALSVVIGTGFETGDASEAIATTGTFSIQSSVTRGPWSAYALRTNPATTGVGRVTLVGNDATGARSNGALSVATSYARFYFRAATLPAPASGDEELFKLVATSGADKFALRINSSGSLVAYDGTPTLLATGTATLATGTWYRVEVKVGTGASAAVEWKIAAAGATADLDGAAVTDVSTTASLSALNTRAYVLGKDADRNGNSVDFYYDDVLVSDNQYPGAGQNTLLLPSANGTYQTATVGAGAGSHFQIVDETPPDGDTSYLVTDGTGGDAETENVADTASASITGTINAAKSLAVLKRDGASNGSVLLRTRVAGTDSDLSAFASTSAYTLCSRLMAATPAGATWTTALLDGAEVGVVEQSANKTRLTFCGVSVDYTPAAAASADQPPRTSPAALYALLQAWVPPDPQPTQRPVTAPVPAQGQQPPKPRGFVPPAVHYEQPQPQQAAEQTAAVVPAAAAQPPYVRQSEVIRRAWDVDAPPPQPLPGDAPLSLTYGQQPPRASPATLYALAGSWAPPDPQPQQRPATAPIPPPVTSQPPPTSGVNLAAIIDSWRAPPPQPPQRAVTVPIPAQGDTPPKARGFVPPSVHYEQPAPPQTARQAAAVATPPPAVSAPPPASWVTLGVLVRSWQPPDPQPTQRPTTAPIPPAAPTPPTPGTVNPYWDVLRAVADVLAGVPGCPAPSVREIPYVLGGADRPPLCFVCPGEGGERLARQTFRKGAWWDYPVLVLLISAGNRVLRAGVEARLQLREDVRQALFVPRLDATTTVMDVDCRPKAAADVRAALGTQYVVSGFQLTYRHVEQRER